MSTQDVRFEVLRLYLGGTAGTIDPTVALPQLDALARWVQTGALPGQPTPAKPE